MCRLKHAAGEEEVELKHPRKDDSIEFWLFDGLGRRIFLDSESGDLAECLIARGGERERLVVTLVRGYRREIRLHDGYRREVLAGSKLGQNGTKGDM